MSEQIKRYTIVCDHFVVPREHPEGAWVRWADVAPLIPTPAPPCDVCGSTNTHRISAVECDNCACIR